MSARVLLSDTFDQWRMKTNEWLSMTNSAGSSNFIKTNVTTNSTSNTTGAITTAGGIGIAKSAVIGGDVMIHGNAQLDAPTVLDTFTPEGAFVNGGTVTTGEDDTGYDVKFFGATSGAYMIYDASSNDLELAGAAVLSIDSTTDSSSTTSGSLYTAGGVGIAKKLYVGTDLDVDGTTNLDVVDIDGAVQIDSTLTIGENDTGYDVKFFGATSGQYMLWDQSADELVLPGTQKLSFHDAAGGENILASADGHLEVNAGTTLDITAPTVDINVATLLNIDGTSQFQRAGDNAAFLVGWNDTGHDVTFYGDTSGQYMLWDESEDELVLSGTMKIKEQADANADTAGFGQLWVNTETPNTLYFTNDAGVDSALASTGKSIAMAVVFGM